MTFLTQKLGYHNITTLEIFNKIYIKLPGVLLLNYTMI